MYSFRPLLLHVVLPACWSSLPLVNALLTIHAPLAFIFVLLVPFALLRLIFALLIVLVIVLFALFIVLLYVFPSAVDDALDVNFPLTLIFWLPSRCSSRSRCSSGCSSCCSSSRCSTCSSPS